MESTKICKVCGRELPIESFQRNGHGYTSVCQECSNKKRSLTRYNNKEQKILDARALRLKDFTPRELMEELARRGYDGKITFTRTETIDLSNL